MEKELKPVSAKKILLKSVINGFEDIFSDKKKKYFDKLQSLPSAWEKIWYFVSDPSSESPQPEFESIFMHTLRLVLIADWTHASKAIKTCLSNNIHRVICTLTNKKSHTSILQQCRLLESVVNKPWEDEVLNKIFNSEEIDIDELIDYFHSECATVIIVRLEILLDSKCEDFAIRLSKSFLWAYHCTDPLEFDIDQNQLNYITDIYYCCLFKRKNRSDLVSELKALNVSEGLQLLKRYSKSGGIGADHNDACKEARVWKSSRNAIESMSNTLLANAVLNAEDDIDEDILHDLLNEWAAVNESTLRNDFSTIIELIRKSVMIAKCSKAMYPFCSFLIKRTNEKCHLNTVLYCLIRTVNLNMNEIELHKVSGDRDKLKSSNEQLAKGFLIIANLLVEHENIYRECMLTAFSLTPSREFIDDLKRFFDATSSVNCNPVEKTERIVDEEKENEKPADNDDAKEFSADEINDKTFDKVSGDDEASPSSRVNAAKSSYVTEVESLSIEESLKTDLNSILRFQRHQALTWDSPLDKLKTICENYLKLFEERGFGEMELKYLELDYDQFKDRPIDYEYGGIEKGYEQFVILSPDGRAAIDDVNAYYSYSSASTTSDSDYELYKRSKKRKKKSSTIRLKRVRRKAKNVKLDDSELNEILESHCSATLNEAEKRWLFSKGFRVPKKHYRRTQKIHQTLADVSTAETLSDANVDSQAENKPPPEENVGALSDDDNSKKKDLTKLREFRFVAAMTPSNWDEAKSEPLVVKQEREPSPMTKVESEPPIADGTPTLSVKKRKPLKNRKKKIARKHHSIEAVSLLNDCLADILVGIDDKNESGNRHLKSTATAAAATATATPSSGENETPEYSMSETFSLTEERLDETDCMPVSVTLKQLNLDNLPFPASSIVTPPVSPPTAKKKRRKSSAGFVNFVPEKTDSSAPLFPVVCLPNISTQLSELGTSNLYSDLRICQPTSIEAAWTSESEAAISSLESVAATSTLESEAAMSTVESVAAASTLKSEAAVSTLELEAAISTLESEAVISTLESEAAMSTLESEAAMSTLESEAAISTLESEAAVSTCESEAATSMLELETVTSTLVSEAVAATLVSEAVTSTSEVTTETSEATTTSLASSSYCESISPSNRNYRIIESKGSKLRVSLKCHSVGNNSHYCKAMTTKITEENSNDVVSSSIANQKIFEHSLNGTALKSSRKKKRERERTNADKETTKRPRKSTKVKTEKKRRSKKNGESIEKLKFLSQSVDIIEVLSGAETSQPEDDNRAIKSYLSIDFDDSRVATPAPVTATAATTTNAFEQNGNLYSDDGNCVFSSIPANTKTMSRMKNGLIALCPAQTNRPNLIDIESPQTTNARIAIDGGTTNDDYDVKVYPKFAIDDNYGVVVDEIVYDGLEIAGCSNFVENGSNYVPMVATTTTTTTGFEADSNYDLFDGVEENPSISVVAEDSNVEKYYDNILSTIQGNSLSQPNDDLYLKNDYNVNSQYADGFINEYNSFKGDNFTYHNGFMDNSINYYYSDASTAATTTTAAAAAAAAAAAEATTTATNYTDQIGNYRL